MRLHLCVLQQICARPTAAAGMTQRDAACCRVGSAWHLRGLDRGRTASQVLPEVTEDRWQYKGIADKRGHSADVWQLKLEPHEGYGTYHSNYTLYVTKASV